MPSCAKNQLTLTLTLTLTLITQITLITLTLITLTLTQIPGRACADWSVAQYNVRFERVIVAIHGSTLTLDAPVSVSVRVSE